MIAIHARNTDANGPTLQRMPEAVRPLQRGRPRKKPPIFVPAGMKYCWSCQSALPLTSFVVDRRQPDGKKMDCGRCDNAARVARRRARLRLQLAA